MFNSHAYRSSSNSVVQYTVHVCNIAADFHFYLYWKLLVKKTARNIVVNLSLCVCVVHSYLQCCNEAVLQAFLLCKLNEFCIWIWWTRNDTTVCELKIETKNESDSQRNLGNILFPTKKFSLFYFVVAAATKLRSSHNSLTQIYCFFFV